MRIGETRIESPIDGLVSQRRLDPGALVGPPGGGAIITVVRVDRLRVFITANEKDAASITVGKEALGRARCPAGKSYGGVVVRVAPSFDPVTRTLDAEVQLANDAGELRPGMYGRAAVRLEVHPRVPVVPVNALQITENQKYVFVLNGTKVVSAPRAPRNRRRRFPVLRSHPRPDRRRRGGHRGRRRALRRRDGPRRARRRSFQRREGRRAGRPSGRAPPARHETDGVDSMWLTRLALRNPVLILMVSLMLLVLGWVSVQPARGRPVSRHHRAGHPRGHLLLGRGPVGHREVHHPAHRARGERLARRRPRRELVEAGVSLVSIWFNFGTNLDNAQFEVSQRVAQILNTLPPGIQQPFIIKFDITNIPVVQVAIVGRRPGREAALRSGLQHDRAAARAVPGRGQRDGGRR